MDSENGDDNLCDNDDHSDYSMALNDCPSVYDYFLPLAPPSIFSSSRPKIAKTRSM